MSSFALVTGAARRIGKAYALALAEMGYDIFLHYRSSQKEAKNTRHLIEEKGQTCILKQAGFNNEEAVLGLIEECSENGSLDILVNNASVFVESTLETKGAELLDNLFAVNFKAPYLLTKQFAKHCKRGLIINMLDTNINQNRTRHLDYLLTKKMLEDFTYISATELAPDIRVNGIAPGLILPPEDQSDAYLQRKAEDIPLRKTGSLKELNQALRLLVNNSFITGEVIHVDGGERL